MSRSYASKSVHPKSIHPKSADPKSADPKSARTRASASSGQFQGQKHSHQKHSHQKHSQLSGHEAFSSHYTASRMVATAQTSPIKAASSKSAVGSKGAKRKPKHPQNHTLKHKQAAANTGAPLIVKRYIRWLFGKNTPRKSGVRHRAQKPAPQKVAIATGSIATLALLAVVPGKVASQSIADTSCQEVIQSGAEISRGELTHLSSIAAGATPESVRGLIDNPYCLLPVSARAASPNKSDHAKADYSKHNQEDIIAREAYPLAFDPEAWIVVNYAESGYVGYDFAFRP